MIRHPNPGRAEAVMVQRLDRGARPARPRCEIREALDAALTAYAAKYGALEALCRAAARAHVDVPRLVGQTYRDRADAYFRSHPKIEEQS